MSFRRPADWLEARGLAPPFHEAFRATARFSLLPMLLTAPPGERAVTRPVTLVGDAAHLMPPFAGVGVNLGLLDALHLADALSGGPHPDLASAIRAYERAMSGYARQAQEETAAAELALHSGMSFEELIAATRPPHETATGGDR